MNKKNLIKKPYNTAIQAFVKKAKDILSDDLIDILVYGSVVREDTHSGSDIDVIVIVKKNAFRNQMKLASLAFDILMDTGEYISVQAMKKKDLQRDTMFLWNVRREAVHAI